MNYIIEGACTSNVGKIRDNNEDNFYFDGQILEEVNTGIEDILTTTFTNQDNRVYAIFDGMGGESKGERASYLGTTTLKEYRKKNQIIEWNELAEKANEKICKEMTNKSRMGSTMAAAQFTKGHITISNLGDSRVYLLSKSSFGQVSQDHTEKNNKSQLGKARLTQYLGIKKEEMIIQPFIKEIQYENTEKLLICSDGLTDMVSKDKIEEVLTNEENPKESVRKLLKEALNNGGEDNTTIMVFTINHEEAETNRLDVKEKIKDLFNLFN